MSKYCYNPAKLQQALNKLFEFDPETPHTKSEALQFLKFTIRRFQSDEFSDDEWEESYDAFANDLGSIFTTYVPIH